LLIYDRKIADVSIMTWNWQQPRWPNFSWDAPRMQKAEAMFLEGVGVAVSISRHLDEADRSSLEIELMSHEAIDTSAIEGETLDRESVQSSIRRHLGLAGGQLRVKLAEAGIAEMTVYLYERATEPLDRATLDRWHRHVVNGRTDLADIGRFRTGGDPTQIVSGPIHRPKIHFEAPSAARVEEEMVAFRAWVERSRPGGSTPIPPLTRAGLAHRIEDEISGSLPDTRRRQRQERNRPQIEDLRIPLDDALRRLSPKSAMAKAIAYGRKRWDALTRYLDEGTAEIDNNAAERAMRAIAIGRKNWLFAGSIAGGERAAAIYSIIETAKLNNVEPQAYIADVIEKIAGGWPASRWNELMPWNWTAAVAPASMAA
jgi:hypothetical protein